MTKRRRRRPGEPRPRRAPVPLDPAAHPDRIWATSWALPGAVGGYGVRVHVGERSWTLGRDRAVAYAVALVDRAVTAEHDAAVVTSLLALGMPLRTAAEFLGRDIRPDRVLDHTATEPLVADPLVALDPDGSVRPFIALHLDGAQAGQFTPADARHHAIAVLEAMAAADLDATLRRVLVGPVGLDEARASAVVARLAEHWPTEEDPRRA